MKFRKIMGMAAIALSERDKAVLELVRQGGVIRARDLDAQGLARTYLRRLQERGLLVSAGRGLYRAAQDRTGEHQTLIEVAQRVPDGVICLLSALRFHEIGTQEPPAVWLAIQTGNKAPRFDSPMLEVVRQSGAAWVEGVETHELAIGAARVPVKITSSAKTVADCFKFRNRVGLDVALEALREVLRSKKAMVGQLWHFAEVNRVLRVMRPYLEAMVVR